nr:MAG TPA: tail protein [Caudoviricetes sp.]
MGVVNIDAYFKALKAPTIYPIAKLYFLNPDETIAFEVGSDFVSGDLSVVKNNGIRRTATVKISNVDKLYSVGFNGIWIGQKIRVDAGIRLNDTEEYLFRQGVFYVKDPEEVNAPTDNSITLNLVDKFAWHDGSLNGELGGIHQINPNDDLRVAARELLLTDSGNGLVADPIPPRFDSYYNDKTATLHDGTTVPFTNAPYTYRTDASGTRADVLLAINTMLVASCGYDTFGRFHYDSAQTDITNFDRPIAWEFSVDESELCSVSYTHMMSAVYNDVKVVGSVLNGTQVQGRATNTNPRSDTSVDKIGYRTLVISDAKYTTFKQCNEYAKYELRKRTIMQSSVSFSATPIYHLNEDDLITLLKEKNGVPEKYLVTGFTLPLGREGMMNISAVSIDDLDVYDKWLTSHKLTVLCSQMGGLKYSYDTTTVDLDNPYAISEIPAGSTVTFTTTSTPKYTISSVTLNEIPLEHTGSGCTFVMPDYDSRIVFTLSLVSGADVTITYTGTYEEIKDTGLDYKVMNGIKYRLWKFATSGNLSFSDTLVEKGMVGDVHCRGAGGGSSDAAAGSNGYDMCEKSLHLENTSIVVGTGGAYSSSKGKRGGVSSFGTDIEAPGGSPATGSASGTGGTLNNPFGSDYADSATGLGGAIASSGANGAVWLRIAI